MVDCLTVIKYGCARSVFCRGSLVRELCISVRLSGGYESVVCQAYDIVIVGIKSYLYKFFFRKY